MRYTISRDKLFLLGMFLYFIGSSFLWLNIALTRIFQLAGITLFIFSFRVKLGKNVKYPKLYKTLILLVFLFGFFIIMRAKDYGVMAVIRKICSPDGILEYIAPLLLFFPLYKYFNYTLNITTKILYLYILFIFMTLPMFISQSEGAFNIISLLYLFLGGALPFLVIFFDNLSRRQKIIVFVATFLTGLIAIWMARRGLLLGLLLAYMFYLFTRLLKQKYRLIKLIFIGTVGIMVYFFLLPALLNLSFFQKITDKGFKDTRTIVEEYLWNDISHDSNTVLYGKGIDGTYYAPNIDSALDDRYSIETGYLHLVLKGGIVYLVLMALIFILPMIKGLFRGRSAISKCAALYLLHGICMMYPGNPFRFMPAFFLMFLCVSLIYSENSKNKF